MAHHKYELRHAIRIIRRTTSRCEGCIRHAPHNVCAHGIGLFAEQVHGVNGSLCHTEPCRMPPNHVGGHLNHGT